MRQLETHDQIIIPAKCLSVSLPADLEHPSKIRSSLLVEVQLPGTGSAIERDSSGFCPDKFGASRAKAKISAKSQLIRPAVERAIATFHGLDAERIAGAEFADSHWPKKKTQIVTKTQIQLQTLTLCLQLRQSVKLKEASHDF
jgi:hypothetical protein